MEVSLNWIAILVATIVSFAGGALWHGPLFGKIWMRIHHGDIKMSAEEMARSMEGLWKLLLAEFVATFIMVMTLDFLMQMLPKFSGMHMAFLVWLGFALPMMTSVVLWGNDQKKNMATKIAVSGSYRLIALVIAGYILSVM